MKGDDEAGALLDEAWDLLDAGDPDAALARLAAMPALATHVERWSLEASARLALDDLAGTRRALSRIEELAGRDSAEHAWAAAELALREWRFADARAALRRYPDGEREAAVLERLALCAELSGDLAQADRLLARAIAASAGELEAPPRLSEEAFAGAVSEAIADLPRAFRHALERVEVVVEPVPGRDLFPGADVPEHPPDLLGLFVGLSELDGESDLTAALPPRILLFQRNLERAAADRAELVDEIRVTLFHEFAHALGFDEEGVEAMGLE